MFNWCAQAVYKVHKVKWECIRFYLSCCVVAGQLLFLALSVNVTIQITFVDFMETLLHISQLLNLNGFYCWHCMVSQQPSLYIECVCSNLRFRLKSLILNIIIQLVLIAVWDRWCVRAPGRFGNTTLCYTHRSETHGNVRSQNKHVYQAKRHMLIIAC